MFSLKTTLLPTVFAETKPRHLKQLPCCSHLQWTVLQFSINLKLSLRTAMESWTSRTTADPPRSLSPATSPTHHHTHVGKCHFPMEHMEAKHSLLPSSQIIRRATQGVSPHQAGGGIAETGSAIRHFCTMGKPLSGKSSSR